MGTAAFRSQRGRKVAIALGVVGLMWAPAALPPAMAKSKIRPPAPPPGWVIDQAVFEPLDGTPLKVGGRGEYRGTIEVVRPRNQGMSVVNNVGFDDYLRGISEVPVSWPMEAQKAQAIAARTYLLYEMANSAATAFRAAGADICATDSCQVYAGVEKERRPGAEAWSAAVDATRGQIIRYKGAPILAKYSSSNGGRTVAGGKPYLNAVDDPDDRRSPLNSWRATYGLGAVGRAMGLGVEPVEVHRAGDVVVATTVDDDGNPAESRLPALDFRARVNSVLDAPEGLPLAVPSMRFGVGTSDGAVVIDGQGWGHGIGLSQHGALGKALRGLKAPDILAAYYGGLRPVTVPAQELPAVVRVALATGSGGSQIATHSGRFRISDGAGSVLAHAASGPWSVAPGPKGKGVRVIPPREQAGPPTAEIAVVAPAVPAPGQPLSVRIRLGGPAAVTGVQLVNPAGLATEIDSPVLRAEGEFDLRLADAAAVGPYTVVVDRDAGAARTTSSPLIVEVGLGSLAPVRAATAPGLDAISGPVKLGAGSLWLAVCFLALTLRRRLPTQSVRPTQ